MLIESFYEPDSGTWTHLLADTGQKVAVIIDPVWVYDPVSGQASRSFIDKVLGRVTQLGYGLEWVLETHAHADHLSAGALIRRETGAKIAIGQGIRDVQSNFKKIYDLPSLAADGRQFDRLFEDGDELRVGGLNIRVMETPGHTRDSITYLVGNAAFIGDTLFTPDYGTARCDFPGGDAGLLYDSIQKIHALPDDTTLYLCHDYPPENGEPISHISIKRSKAGNVHINPKTNRQAYIEMREARDAK
ncbi:MAG: MBL fold metallo-hydrolase, partial [Gammaproteobacteria bacterium]|nr:MBL fold metallo-hydrolase [Gammaproteobacteria bacterium]